MDYRNAHIPVFLQFWTVLHQLLQWETSADVYQLCAEEGTGSVSQWGRGMDAHQFPGQRSYLHHDWGIDSMRKREGEIYTVNECDRWDKNSVDTWWYASQQGTCISHATGWLLYYYLSSTLSLLSVHDYCHERWMPKARRRWRCCKLNFVNCYRLCTIIIVICSGFWTTLTRNFPRLKAMLAMPLETKT